MRQPRNIRRGSKYHVVAKINRGEMLFLQRNGKYKLLFLAYIEKAKKRYDFNIYTICIMSNHVHIIIKPLESSQLCDIMKSVLGGFARRYNVLNSLHGHVWYDRFKSKIIDSLEQYIRTIIYIAHNPVRAAIVDHPLNYSFSGITAIFKKYKKIPEETKRILRIIKKPKKEVLGLIQDYLRSFDDLI